MFNRIEPERMLFVWDGTKESIKIADEVISNYDNLSINCLHVLPHESICAYATAGYSELEPVASERRIHKQFEKCVAASKRIATRKLEIVFGDRLTEILRYGEIVRANVILMPQFKQSLFSSWLHGDLNRRMIEDAGCSVRLYNSKTEAWAADAQPKKNEPLDGDSQ